PNPSSLHAATQWIVRAGATVVYDSGLSADLTRTRIDGLPLDTPLTLQATHFDDDGNSAPSLSVPFVCRQGVIDQLPEPPGPGGSGGPGDGAEPPDGGQYPEPGGDITTPP